MKKVFTFLMAMVIVMASFAQSEIITPSLTQKVAKEFNFQKPVIKHNLNQDKNMASSFWFEYSDGLANMMALPEGLDGARIYMCADTNAYVNWSNSNPGPAQYQSTGHVYDWTHSCWNSFYYASANYTNVPALWATPTYSIDSIEIVYWYTDASGVAANVVDTLEISYLINLDNEAIHQYRSIDEATLDTLWVNAALWIPIDPTTSMPTMASTPWGGTDVLNENVGIYTEKYLLHQSDTSSTAQVKKFATPSQLSNLNCKRLAVFYTYRPGTQGHTIIDSTCREFTFYASEDPRDEYTNGGELPRGDLNMNYSTYYGWTLNPESAWYVTAMPDFFWVRDRYHTYIGLHAVCDDCAIVNVEDAVKESATIYPNPASSEINVVTNSNEKTLVEMYNLVGQKVYSEQFVNSTKINVSNMKSGVYMLKVNNHTTKVVVK